MKKRLSGIILLLLSILLFMLSCPAPSTNLVDNGSVAYQKPPAPKNVVATKGQQDSIVLSWDPVTNAELYIVYGIEGSSFDSEMQPYAYTTNNTITFSYVAPGTSLGAEDEAIDIPRSFDRDEIYIFCVKAYVSYESADDYLLSASSDYAEGCFAPSTVEFYPIVSSDKVRLMWNCSNLFSILNTGLEPKPLYKTQFTVTYVDESTKESKTITAKDVGAKSDPWLFAELPASDYFTHDNRYTFTVQLSVLDDEGNSIATVSSASVTITMNDSLLASAIEDISATDGTLAGKVEITWKIPSWSLPVTRSNSYYTVQRREAGTSEWISILDEISTMTASADISFNGNECTYYDVTAEQGKSYEYQILNVFVDNTGTAREGEGEPGVAKGSVFTPEASDLKAEWTPEDGTYKGTAKLSWSAISSELPDGLKWAIRKTVWHGYMDRVETAYVSTGISNPSGNERVISITEDVSTCTTCNKGNSIHTYSYDLVITDSADTVIYEIGSFDLDNASLGEPIENQIFRDFRVSSNLVKKIRLSWTVADEYVGKSINYSYIATANDVNSEGTLTDIHSNGPYCYADIDVKDGETFSIKLKATDSVSVYESPTALTGKSIDSLSDIAFMADDGASGNSIGVKWNSFASAADVSYSIVDGKGEILISVNPAAGEAVIPMGTGTISNTGDKHTLRLIAVDSEKAKLESNPDEGYVLPMPTNIIASKGDYSGEIRISWTGYGDMVDGYEVLKYLSASLAGDPIDTFQANTNEYIDSDVTPDIDYYYVVRSVKGNADSEYLTEFDETENILPGIMEQDNLGYTFNPIPIKASDVMITELEDPNHAGYVADFIRMTFPANKTAASYTIESALAGYEYPVTYEIDNALTTEVDGLYTNGKGSDAVGYVAYDKDEDTITINTNAGILNSNLEIEDIRITGDGKSDVLTTEPTRVSTNNANRNPNLYDYINIFNSVLSETLTDADDNMGDWAVWAAEEPTYMGSGYEIERAIKWAPTSDSGSLKFNGRVGNEYPVKLSSDEAISFEADVYSPFNLEYIANSDDDKNVEIELSFNNTVYINTSSLKIKYGIIKVFNLDAHSTDYGTYWITPEFGTESEAIDYSLYASLIPNTPNIR